MDNLEFNTANSVHLASDMLAKLTIWLEDNSTALKRTRSNPVPQTVELLQFARRLERVTAREFQVFEQVIEGLTAVQIGERLNISPRTVDVHKSRFIQKMEIGNMVIAARYFSILETLVATQNIENSQSEVAKAG